MITVTIISLAQTENKDTGPDYTNTSCNMKSSFKCISLETTEGKKQQKRNIYCTLTRDNMTNVSLVTVKTIITFRSQAIVVTTVDSYSKAVFLYGILQHKPLVTDVSLHTAGLYLFCVRVCV